MSGDNVLQDAVSVGTAQAAAEHLCLAAQCLLGQPAHVSHCRDRADTRGAVTVHQALGKRLLGINAYNLHLDHHLFVHMWKMSHRERHRSCINACVWDLENWYTRSYWQNRDTDTQTQRINVWVPMGQGWEELGDRN